MLGRQTSNVHPWVYMYAWQTATATSLRSPVVEKAGGTLSTQATMSRNGFKHSLSHYSKYESMKLAGRAISLPTKGTFDRFFNVGGHTGKWCCFKDCDKVVNLNKVKKNNGILKACKMNFGQKVCQGVLSSL